MMKWLSIPLILLVIIVFIFIFGERTIDAQSSPQLIPVGQTVDQP